MINNGNVSNFKLFNNIIKFITKENENVGNTLILVEIILLVVLPYKHYLKNMWLKV